MPKDVVRARGRDIVAPYYDAFWDFVLWSVVPLREPLRCVQDAIIPLDGLDGGDSGTVTGDPTQREHDVGAAISVGEHTDPGADVSAGAHGKDHALRAKFLPDLAHLFFHEIERLIPGNLLPLTLPTLPHPLERTGQPVRMIGILCHRQATGAETSLIPGMIRVTLDLDQLAIFDVRQYPAAAVTARPGGPGSGAHDLATFMLHLSSPSRKAQLVRTVSTQQERVSGDASHSLGRHLQIARSGSGEPSRSPCLITKSRASTPPAASTSRREPPRTSRGSCSSAWSRRKARSAPARPAPSPAREDSMPADSPRCR